MPYNQEDLFKQIQETVAQHPVVVYMKGEHDMPMCGFSGQVIHILKTYKVPIYTINVLDDQNIRQAIKDFNHWPTVPQIFIEGEFIGGCDILKELHQSGDLAQLLGNITQI